MALAGVLSLVLPSGIAQAQQPQWTPPQGSIVRLIDLAGRTVTSNRIQLATPDPWAGKRWPNCGAPDAALYARRYLGGNQSLFTAGHNCTGFQNELAFLGARAVAKTVSGSVSGYVPLCMEVTDFNCTHSRTCLAYSLTFEDGCGSGSSDPEVSSSLPKRLADYCNEWGWTAPGHAGPANAPCKAYRGCERSACPCFEERRSTSASGGAWVFFDPTQPECRPDRRFDGGGGGPGGGDDGGDDGSDDGGDDGSDDGGDDGGDGPGGRDPQGPRNACDEALEDLEAALKKAQMVCPVGG